MKSVILIILTIVFAYLTYDAFRLQKTSGNTPHWVIAKLRGQDINHLSHEKQIQLADMEMRWGLGQAGRVVWLFLILTIAFATLAVREFLQ